MIFINLLNFNIFYSSFYKWSFGSNFLFRIIPKYLYYYTIGIFSMLFVLYSHLFNISYFVFINIIPLFSLFNIILKLFDHFSIRRITSFASLTLRQRQAMSSAKAYTPLQHYYNSFIRLLIYMLKHIGDVFPP